MNVLRFTVYGRVCSNNRVTRRVGDLSLKSKEAREDTRRIREIASVAAGDSTDWDFPQAAMVTVEAYNVRADIDNICKVILDAMKGVAYHDDRDIMDLKVSRRWDREGERYCVTVDPSVDFRPGRQSAQGRCVRPGAKQTPLRPFSAIRSGDTLTFAERDALLRGLTPKPR